MPNFKRLNHTLGRHQGPDPVAMSQFVSWIEANLRLGNSMVIDISQWGDVDAKADHGLAADEETT